MTEQPWRDEDRMRDLYVDEELTSREVAERLGCSKSTVLDWLDKLGIPKDPAYEVHDGEWKDEGRLRQMYLVEGKPTSQIAEELGCTTSVVCKYMDRFGIEREGRKARKDVPFRDEDTLRTLYWDEGMSIPEVADETGSSATTIRKWMDHYGIERRDHADAAASAVRVGYATFTTGSDGYEFWQSRTKDGLKHLYVHRLLAVSEYGFDAVCGQVVHHKNEVKWDNRAENIEVMDTREHTRLHQNGGGADA
ncbi:HNH endonuclease [Haloparvum sedimenti]|uniref:HNH endonuclease n=1 Tax=Haloparvum sedimenti TaxID=1678448 RepID=UPI001FDFD7F0|nr:HNH endonuclease [Haloparvum sedimenti]